MSTRQNPPAETPQRTEPSHKAAHLPQTLGELRTTRDFNETRLRTRNVKDEMRENLIARLKAHETIFPGIIGYEDTVVPQIVNAVLSRQNFILLGLRGQAKSRILRALTALLDEHMPYVAGCEIRDNPFQPICRRCRDLIVEQGDATPLGWLSRDERYVEKLATPDVTVADLIGDLDPIKAARGGHDLASEMTMHYGLLPRANRGIFAVNELPDLAGKIQVALFNIMQEGDVQIKGYPVRLELDVALVFSANPEDYTARGKIVTPLKDRIGSEIRTHYPETLEEGIAITAQEAWTQRELGDTALPQYLREVIEQVAFTAREDKKVDKRSGVSQRLPISTLELAVSNAERRALLHGESRIAPRVGDLFTALPGITGKLELEYEVSTSLVEEALRPGAIEVTGNAGPHAAPWGVYPCAGDDEWCVVTVRDDDDWRRLRDALGNPQWTADPDLAGTTGRLARRTEIDEHLTRWTRALPPREVTATLQAAGVPAGFMQRPEEFEDDPQLQARDFLSMLEQPGLEPRAVDNAPFRSQRIPAPAKIPAPEPGEHTREICTGLLGLMTDEVDRLIASGVLEEAARSPEAGEPVRPR
jgi:magnesium chelatase subunit I